MKESKISIVTVSYNAVDTIEQTILSVIGQEYPNIEYIVIDGGSTDGTVNIIRKYEDKIAYWVSEPDAGMYDALAKGFARVTGDICAYINADDFYQPHAFATVSQIFRDTDCRWITGINAIYNSLGQIVDTRIPFRYRDAFIQKGFYDGKWLPFIQQESTFWKSTLLQYVDFNQLRSLKFAGDYYLWTCFSKWAKLDVVSCVFAGFRKRKGQLSESINEYRRELKHFCLANPNLMEKAICFLDKVRGGFPVRLNRDMIRFNFEKERWGKNGKWN